MLHLQAKALLDQIEQTGGKAFHELAPEDARERYRDRRLFTQPDPPDVACVRDLNADGPRGPIPLRLYRPLASADAVLLPFMVYFHGGGFVIGDLDTHDVLCRELSNGSNCALISVNYRLAPEHKFPAAVEDCVAATEWIYRNASSLGVDPKRMAVGGDSAGANLAAVVCISARDQGIVPIRFQLLIYPTTETRSAAPSHSAHGTGYLLTQQTLDYFHDLYIDDPTHDTDWRASPLLHDDLANLPAALVLTAGYDPLRDEALAYSQRLSNAGGRVSHICFERQMHGFLTMGKVIDEANTAVAICAGEIRRVLGA